MALLFHTWKPYKYPQESDEMFKYHNRLVFLLRFGPFFGLSLSKVICQRAYSRTTWLKLRGLCIIAWGYICVFCKEKLQVVVPFQCQRKIWNAKSYAEVVFIIWHVTVWNIQIQIMHNKPFGFRNKTLELSHALMFAAYEIIIKPS